MTNPLYFALHLWTSPLVAPASGEGLLPDLLITLSIPPAAACAFILPSVLASLPAPAAVSGDVKQILMAAWQPLPLWAGVLAYVFRYVLSVVVPARSVQRLRAHPLAAPRALYALSLAGGLAARAGSLAISATATLFPTLFTPEAAAELAVIRVFWPVTALHTTPVHSAAEGVLLLLQWDWAVGSAVSLARAAVLFGTANRAMGKVVDEWLLLGAVVGGTALLGPGGCVVALTWARDELVLSGK